MSTERNERLDILAHLKQAAVRLSELASAHPGTFGSALRAIADEIAADAVELEAELNAIGYGREASVRDP